jgi:hypothetical protein
MPGKIFSEFFPKFCLMEVTEKFGMGYRNKIEPLKVARPASRIGVGPPPANLRQESCLNVKGEQLPMSYMSG